MKIVHLIPEFNRGGTERIVINLAKIQMKKGHSVKIIAFSDLNLYQEETSSLDILVFKDVEVQYRFMRKPITNLQEMEKALNTFEPNVIHSHSYWTDLIINAIPVLPTKYISHFHLYYDEYTYKFSLNPKKLAAWRGLKMLNAAYKKRKTNFVAISEDIENYYKHWLPVSLANRVTKIANFLQFLPEPKQKVYIPEDKLKLLSVGRLVKIKNHAFLVELAKELVVNQIDFSMTIAGEGNERGNLENKAKELGVENYINFCGVVENMPDLYRDNDIYIHSAKAEPFGLTILESMSFGLPCVIFKTNGPKEIITNSREGVLVDDLDVKLFAEKIIEIKDNSELYESISNAAYERSCKFNIEDYYIKLMQTYLAP
jgi:glycosyltransferase involved in cell wall biosynthesis